jgi:hypothetical protein
MWRHVPARRRRPPGYLSTRGGGIIAASAHACIHVYPTNIMDRCINACELELVSIPCRQDISPQIVSYDRCVLTGFLLFSLSFQGSWFLEILSSEAAAQLSFSFTSTVPCSLFYSSLHKNASSTLPVK